MFMKRAILVLLSILMIALAGCGGGQTQQERQEKTQTTSSQNAAAPVRTDRTLIVYFSATGHTKRLAETTARALGAELQEIQPKKPYREIGMMK